jgi:3-dehydroquinate synthase
LIRVSVQTASQPYDALIESGVVRSAGVYINELMPKVQRYYIVTVPKLRKLYGKYISDSFKSLKLDPYFVEMPDGERRKTLATIEAAGSRMVKLGADRNSVIVALGGGVVGDMAGFLASIYMRGIAFVQVPTTFLAQVDASVGGKTGVNLEEGKNLLGTFLQPRMVIIDPGVLRSLPEREFRSGLFEALKAGIIQDARIFEFMEQNRDKILARDPAALEWLIAESVRVKASVVSADEQEHGLRRILNLGHTIGHALEAETEYKHFFHGEAVAWGMVAAAMIAVGLQLTDTRTAQRIIGAVFSYAPLPKVDVRPKAILKRLTNDKKTVDGKVHFILPREIGKVEVNSEVPERAVLQAVEELRYLSQA